MAQVSYGQAGVGFVRLVRPFGRMGSALPRDSDFHAYGNRSLVGARGRESYFSKWCGRELAEGRLVSNGAVSVSVLFHLDFENFAQSSMFNKSFWLLKLS